MRGIARRKVHFAPLTRQQKEINRLLRARRFRNVTEFMRAAIDHYLDSVGRPPLSQQARQQAEDFAQSRDRDADELQAPSMSTRERW
jgi:Arc/MetJ-type ribon-helix-helix transcriptional regulator